MGIGQKLPGVLLDSQATYLLDRHMFALWTWSGHHRAVGDVPPHGDTQSVALVVPTSEPGGFEVSDVDCALIEPDKLRHDLHMLRELVAGQALGGEELAEGGDRQRLGSVSRTR
jgi:hypothetical protein